MNSFFARTSQAPPTSGRATVAHLGRAQQPQPTLTSGRALVGQLGVGRRYTGATNLLQPYPLAQTLAPLPAFAPLDAQARQLHWQLANYDRQAALADSVAPAAAPLPPLHPRAQTPAEAGYPVPFLSPAEQARRARERRGPDRARFLQQRLAAVNAIARVVPFSPKLLEAMRSPFLDPRAKMAVAVGGPATPAGSDSFMPTSFWKSQNPNNDPKVGWAKCCATVKAMMESVNGKGKIPTNWYNVVQEHPSSTEWVHGFRKHDDYMVAPNASRATLGLQKLDQYMTLHKPVMVGVSHTLGMLFSKKNKATGETEYRQINDGTIDHFVAIVGTGVDKKGKYYRFFDVGTVFLKKGTDPHNRLYLNSATGFYEGISAARPGGKYVLTQLRFY